MLDPGPDAPLDLMHLEDSVLLAASSRCICGPGQGRSVPLSPVLMLIAAALQVAGPAQGELIFVPPMPEPSPASPAPGPDCLMLDQVRSTRIIAGTGIVYRLSSRRQFINRLRGRADALTSSQVMLVRTSRPLLCAGDIVYLAEGPGGEGLTFVGLGRFERYDPSIAQGALGATGSPP